VESWGKTAERTLKETVWRTVKGGDGGGKVSQAQVFGNGRRGGSDFGIVWEKRADMTDKGSKRRFSEGSPV